jgi:DNA ligase (NAD+)
MLTETEVTNIVWQLGKTGEMIPVINFKPIELDGKIITKCSGHNYGTLIKKQISVGTKIIVRLAGDIIPDLYRVTDTSKYSVSGIEIPDNCIVDGVHLMAVLDENTRNKNAFIASSTSLNIPSIGPKIAEQIYDYVTKDNGETDEFFGEKYYIGRFDLVLYTEEDNRYVLYFWLNAHGKKFESEFKERYTKK